MNRIATTIFVCIIILLMTGCSKILKHSEQQNEKLTSSSREQTLGEEGQILVNNLIYLLETRNKLKNQQKHFIATDISYDDIIDCKEFHINSDPDKLMNGEVEMSEGASRGCTAIEEARQNLENLFPRLHDTCSDLYKTCPSVNLDGCLRHQYLPYLVDSYAIILYANSTQEYTRTPETSFYDLLPDFFSSQSFSKHREYLLMSMNRQLNICSHLASWQMIRLYVER